MEIKELAKHKYVVGGVALVGLFVLYLLMKSRSGASSSNSGLATIAAANSQEQQLQAAANLQESQIGAQTQAAQLAASVATNQVNAQTEAANHSVDASLIAALAQNRTTQGANALTAGYLTHQTDAQIELARLQAGLTSQGLTESAALEGESLTHQYNLNSEIVGEVGKAGLNHGTSSLENSLTAILSEVENQPAVGVAAENTNAVGAVASASQFNTLVNTIGNLGSSALKGLAL